MNKCKRKTDTAGYRQHNSGNGCQIKKEVLSKLRDYLNDCGVNPCSNLSGQTHSHS